MVQVVLAVAETAQLVILQPAELQTQVVAVVVQEVGKVTHQAQVVQVL